MPFNCSKTKNRFLKNWLYAYILTICTHYVCMKMYDFISKSRKFKYFMSKVSYKNFLLPLIFCSILFGRQSEENFSEDTLLHTLQTVKMYVSYRYVTQNLCNKIWWLCILTSNSILAFFYNNCLKTFLLYKQDNILKL